MAAKPALDAVAQTDQAEPEEHEAGGRGIAGTGQQRHQPGELRRAVPRRAA